jgi:cytidylate kinase
MSEEFFSYMSSKETNHLKKLDEAFVSIKLDRIIPEVVLEDKEYHSMPTHTIQRGTRFIHSGLIDYTNEDVFNIILNEMNLNQEEVLSLLNLNQGIDN